MKKILIVDDQIIPLMITENMLVDQYQTFIAQSPQEAMEIYRREKPDLVIAAFRMPGMTGYEMQIELQNEFHKKIPFMFMTADEGDESSVPNDPLADLIYKPFKPENLLRRIEKLLQTSELLGKAGMS